MSRARAWLPAIAWAALIFALSSRPRLPVDLEPGTDKIAHFLAYAVLGVLLARAREAEGFGFGWALALGLAYAASDEWHQSFVPGRATELGDWIADALGVGAGLYFYHRARLARPQRYRS